MLMIAAEDVDDDIDADVGANVSVVGVAVDAYVVR